MAKMGNIPFELSVVGGEREIYNSIKREIKLKLESKVGAVALELDKRLKNLLKRELKNQEAKGGSDTYYDSLKSGYGMGNLRAEFGIDNPESVDALVEQMSDFIKTTSGRVIGIAEGIRTGLTVAVEYTTPSITQRTRRGDNLPWAQWLLEEGGKVIIEDYDILYKTGGGRTGQAIMISNKRTKRRWSVPPQFQGTVKDNWLTQTLERIIPDIEVVVENVMTRAFQ